MLGGKAGYSLRLVIDLLEAICVAQSLSGAAMRLGISYRHAWGLIRSASRDFGAPLLNVSRGRRASLSVLGAKLVEAEYRVGLLVTSRATRMVSEIEAELLRMLPAVRTPAKMTRRHSGTSTRRSRVP